MSVTMLFGQNIGMHTITPDAPVHIFSSGQVNTSGGLLLLGSRFDGHLEMDFDIIQSRYGAFDVLPLKLQPLGGNVGIHTSFPDAPLHVSTSGQVNTPGGALLIGSRSDGHIELDFDLIQSRYGLSTVLPLRLQPDGGNVGIHTYAPAAPLHVNSSGEVNMPGGLGLFGNPFTGHLEVDYDRIQSNFGDVQPLSLSIQPDGGNLDLAGGDIFINAAANRVGILDPTPEYALDVNGDIGILQDIFRKSDNDTYIRMTDDAINVTAGNRTFLSLVEIAGQDYARLGHSVFDVDVYLNNALFVQGSNYQVGIGNSFTSPTAQLHILAEPFEDALKIESDGQNRMLINNAGNIEFGQYGAIPAGEIISYKPMEIITWPSSVNTALWVQGGDVSTSLGEIHGGGLEVGVPFFTSLHFDGDEIQAEDGIDDLPGTLHLNKRGGNIKLGYIANSKVGINVSDFEDPRSDLHVQQSFGSDHGQSGIRLESNAFEYWRMAINYDEELELWYASDLKAWCSPTDGTWGSVSDKRLKKDIQTLPSVLDRVQLLRPVQYHMLDQTEEDALIHGFIAQEVKEIFPELVTDLNGTLGINYTQFSPIAIKAIQELSATNASLKSQLASQQNILDQLKDDNMALSERLSALERALHSPIHQTRHPD